MEVSTTVSRYKHLAKHADERKERAERVRVAQIDFSTGPDPVKKEYTDSAELIQALVDGKKTEESIEARVYVLEDLSRAMIEAFGAHSMSTHTSSEVSLFV